MVEKYLQYTCYLIRHKWFVFLECCKIGMIWRGLVHDLSKFRLSEFIPYAKFFYEIKELKDKSGYYYKPTDMGNEAFNYAWFLHQKRNKHHWQWWTLPGDEGGLKILEMPEKYINEMVCDWIGARRAQRNSTTCLEWYDKNKNRIKLHPKTRELLEHKLKQRFR